MNCCELLGLASLELPFSRAKLYHFPILENCEVPPSFLELLLRCFPECRKFEQEHFNEHSYLNIEKKSKEFCSANWKLTDPKNVSLWLFWRWYEDLELKSSLKESGAMIFHVQTALTLACKLNICMPKC